MPLSAYCNGIDDCGDSSDEPHPCQPIGSTLGFNPKDILKAIPNLNTVYGVIYGSIAGIIVLIFTIITTLAAVITTCACKKSCPLYKWRQRRQQPPVGVIVTEPNEQLHNNYLLEESNIGKLA